jgi:O-antigen ligase
MGKTFEGVLRAVKGSGERSLLKYADWLVFGGIVLLTVTLLRYPEPRSAWRLVVLTLALVSLVVSFGKSRSANVPPQIVRLAALYAGIFVAVFAASIAGSTFELAGRQFGNDFLIPSLLPLLLWNHVASERRWQILMYSLAIAAIVLIFANFLQYVREWRQFGGISNDITLHRKYAVNLVFGLSFVIWLGFAARMRWIRWVAWLLVPLTIAMIIGTGSRGAWLGAMFVIVTFGVVTRSRMYGIVLSIGLVISILAAVAIVPGEFVAARVQQGFDTTGRLTGTWAPALEMAIAHPFLGHGFGDNVFHDEYNRLVVDREHWPIKASIGPHSFLLALAFAAGFPALILLVMLMLALIVLVMRNVRKMNLLASSHGSQWALSATALIAGFVAAYGVMGLFENLSWTLFGQSLGLLLVWLRLTGAAIAEGG